MLELFGGDGMYVTTNITPISEELMKAIPVLYFAVLFSDDRETLLSIAFALGVGFAVLENAVILTQQISNVTITWALTRVVGAALMHGACTAAVGMGMSYIRKRRKLFFCSFHLFLRFLCCILHPDFFLRQIMEHHFFQFLSVNRLRQIIIKPGSYVLLPDTGNGICSKLIITS